MGSLSGGGVGLDKGGSEAQRREVLRAWGLVAVAAWVSLGLQRTPAALLKKDSFQVT